MAARDLKARLDAIVTHSGIPGARAWVELAEAPPLWVCSLDTPAQPTGVPLLKATSEESAELAVEALAALLLAKHQAVSAKLAGAIAALSPAK